MNRLQWEKIANEIAGVLSNMPTSKELAEWYMLHRPSRKVRSELRTGIRNRIAGFKLLEGKDEVVAEIAEACIYFLIYINIEAGKIKHTAVNEALTSSGKAAEKIKTAVEALDLVNALPLSIETKSELLLYTSMLCKSSDIVYLKYSQVVALQELCFRIPAATEMVVDMMAHRPTVNAPHGKDLLFQQALTRIIYKSVSGSIPTTRAKTGPKTADLTALTAGILADLFGSCPTFSVSVDIVKNTIK
ncbi:hypothetical protein L4X63_20475 [Geomonas sp. Red32]|uniref:hypothetical protein n=1 Tax=Geomonas sp. Red32 TaxID=2912856 RepID=UPI00202CDDD4|nr:hypothetical protein [Geomonas sp. Red32]MCM0083962.1 hypothetical protein [Geomonas sp. Red32]